MRDLAQFWSWGAIPAVLCRLGDPRPVPLALWVCFFICKMDASTGPFSEGRGPWGEASGQRSGPRLACY